MKTLFVGFVALILGMALTLAFAPYEVFPLAVLVPTALFALWIKCTPKQAFWLGFLFGLGFFTAGVYWLYISIHTIGDVPPLLTGLIMGGMIAFLSLYPAYVGYLANRYFPVNNATKILCVFPTFWVASEIVRCWLFTGFPWLLLGYSQTNSPLRGYAPIFSVYGISLAIVLSSALVLNAGITIKKGLYRSAYFNLFIITAIWTLGALLNLIPWTSPQGQPVPVSLVQGNIPQSMKWSPEHLQLSLDTYETLTASLWSKNRIIFWPEAAVPLPLQQAKKFINTMDNQAITNNAHLILGIPIRSPDKKGYYNGVVTLGKEKHVYLKRLLVPFAEYTPFEKTLARTLNFLHLPFPEGGVRGSFTQEPFMIGGIKILTSICYEIAFPDLSRSPDKTIGLLLTLTNDAWFGKSIAQAQHLQMAEMRALEFNRPLLFVSNDGITAIIGPHGYIESSAPTHETFVLNGTVQPMVGLTPWMRNGTDPLLIIMIGLVIYAIRVKRRVIR